MQPLKHRISPSPLRLILAGATALSIALALPAQAEEEIPQSQTVPATTSQNQNKSPSPPTAVQSRPIKPPDDAWDISWKVIAGLGLLSGSASLAMNIYFRSKTRDNLKILNDKLNDKIGESRKAWQEGAYNLSLHDKKASKMYSEISKQIDSQSESYRNQLTEQYAIIDRLANKLELLKRDIPSSYSQDLASSGFSSERSLPPAPPPALSHADEVAAAYTLAVLNNDRSRIRSMTEAELNITQDSEDALTRGTSIFKTKLQNVSGGGSYLLIERGNKNWICPTAQTLNSFTTNRPQKKIFEYEECASMSSPELKQPAEVYQIHEGLWEVINKGVVLVPA